MTGRAVTLALLRAILRLYPARFRDRFSADVVDSVRGELDRASRRGGAAGVRVSAAPCSMPWAGSFPNTARSAGPSIFTAV